MIKYAILYKKTAQPLKTDEESGILSYDKGLIALFDSYDEGFKTMNDTTAHNYLPEELQLIAVDT
jgi:hypothetical protein